MVKSRRQTLREACDEIDRLRYFIHEERESFNQRVMQATEAYRFEIAQLRAQNDAIMKHFLPMTMLQSPFILDKEETLSGVVKAGKVT